MDIFTFDELDDQAKEKARSWWRGSVISDDWGADFVIDDANEIASLFGLEISTRPVRLYGGGTRQEPAIFYSGFCSQGDGACFEGHYRYHKDGVAKVKAFAPTDDVLHAIARDLAAVQRPYFYNLTAKISHRGRYHHEHSMDIDVEDARDRWRDLPDEVVDEVKDILRRFACWIYRRLDAEHNYQNSDEQVDESIICNGYTFRADGRREDP
jgi:hypothetical protein